MTRLVDGKLIRDELTKNAMGGTELLALRMERDLGNRLEGTDIVFSRPEGIILDKEKINILYLHDLANDPAVYCLADREFRERFDKIVFVSWWQARQYVEKYNISDDEFVVIDNSIDPFTDADFAQYKTTEQVRLIYHTTPHRGLDLLTHVFKHLVGKYGDKIHLDVYSSFDIYGWGSRNKHFEPLFDEIRSANNQMTYHGTVSNDEVRQALIHSDIFAYPSTWQETSALSVIEAMAARNYVIYPDYAALPETGSRFGVMYRHSHNPHIHIQRFASVLDVVINQLLSGQSKRKDENHYLQFQSSYFNGMFNAAAAVDKWTSLLASIRYEIALSGG